MLVALSIATTAPVVGQVDPLEQARYFTECAPVGLGVYVSDDDDELVSLTEDRVRTMAESRLAAARLGPRPVDEETDAVLFLAVTVHSAAYAYNVMPMKRLTDEFTGGTSLYYMHVFPWVDGVGIHSGDEGGASIIMQQLTEHVDDFILTYLQRNEGYCR